MNRPPQKADPWFDQHQKECGGVFEKISEEEKKEKIDKIKKKNQDINNENL